MCAAWLFVHIQPCHIRRVLTSRDFSAVRHIRIKPGKSSSVFAAAGMITIFHHGMFLLLALLLCTSCEAFGVGSTAQTNHFQRRPPLRSSASDIDVSSARVKFPYGECSFQAIVSDKSFCVDKTAYIRTLEEAGKYNKLWRPRRFGKSFFCGMLAEYYDAANSKEKVTIPSSRTVSFPLLSFRTE